MTFSLGSFGAAKSPASRAARAKQYLLLIGAAFALFGILWLIFAVKEDRRPQHLTSAAKESTKAGPAVSITAPGEPVDYRDRWIGLAGNQVADHERKLTEQTEQNKRILERFKQLEERLSRPQAAGVTTAPAPTPAPPAPGAIPEATTPAAKASPASGTTIGGSTWPPGTPAQLPANLPGGRTDAMSGTPKPSAPPIGLVHVSLGSPAPVPPGATTAPAAPGTTASGPGSTSVPARRLETFLPVGFVKTQILGGVDAPTGGQSQNNPLPVFLRLTDYGVLPNRFRPNLRECLVVASSYGDIAAERAYIRSELLSCVRKDGQVIEIKLKGSVYGEDGRVGVRGRLVTKQGQLLANALLSGVMSGLGQGLQARSTTTAISPLGATTVATPGQEFNAGFGAGIGRALDRLANYYISLAEKVYPVIEVGADRYVELAITQGAILPVPLDETADAARSALLTQPLRPNVQVAPREVSISAAGDDDE